MFTSFAIKFMKLSLIGITRNSVPCLHASAWNMRQRNTILAPDSFTRPKRAEALVTISSMMLSRKDDNVMFS